MIVYNRIGAAAYERAEDPLFVLENNIPIDTRYYLENQLAKPLMRIFEPLLSHPEELISGDHTRVVQISAPTTGIMSKFTIKKETCYGCKALLQKDELLLCKHCIPRASELYLQAVLRDNELEEKYSKLWTQCQRCQGSLLQEVLCSNFDCPIFYMRKKVQKDVVSSGTIVSKFYDLSNRLSSNK